MSRRLPDSTCEWFGVHNPGSGVVVHVIRPCGHDNEREVVTCYRHLAELMVQGGLSPVTSPCPVCGQEAFAQIEYGNVATIVAHHMLAHWKGEHTTDKQGTNDACPLCVAQMHRIDTQGWPHPAVV